MLRRRIIIALFSILLIGVSHAPVYSAVERPTSRLRTITSDIYTQKEDGFIEIIALLVNAFFAVLGIIFIVIVLIAGYDYMTSGGDSTKAKKGLEQIRLAIIGILIMLGSFAIWQFILTNFLTKVSE